MAVPGSWKSLTSDGKDLVLAVDFAVTGRPQAGFPEFVALAHPQFSLWETLPPAPEEDAGMTGADYVERWAQDVLRDGRPVRAVMGYCVGAVYAAALAERIGRSQGETPVLIGFDPELPRRDVVCHHFLTTMEGMSGLLKPEEIAHAQQAAGQALTDEGDIKKFGERLLEIFREVGGAAFARVGLDAKRSEEFVATFGLFLHFFVRGSDLDPTAGWKSLTAMTSATPTSGLNPLSEADRAARVAKEIRFPVEHADLLRTPDVATTVTGLLS
ncbi:hypothetical protein Spla01_00501 [Streptomyces platensis]|uniref:Dimodular nonribosomal peptide synthase n=1 Tax=Streptomyces platensis TaxID=58346 RepID=A0ABX3Y209_STRPT|nr:hypothetical protein BG653_01546 [Streptomyces platensis]BCK72980.1 hypothetical protein Srufu_069330 [Streptomyces libani subsp. rufus]